MSNPEIPIIPDASTDEPYVLEFDAFAVCESQSEAEELFDRLVEAVEEILCGRAGESHTCPREWTAGGHIHPTRGDDE